MTVDGGLGVDAPDAFEMPHKEGIDRQERSGVWSLDVSFPELGTEALEKLDLGVGELDLLALDVSFQSEEALMFGKKIVSFPDSSNASCET